MKTLLGNSSMPNYVKITATLLLGCTYLAALAIAVNDYLNNVPLQQLIVFILGTGIGLASQTLGLHTGASLAETIPPSAVAPNTTSTTTQTNITKEVSTDASTPTA